MWSNFNNVFSERGQSAVRFIYMVRPPIGDDATIDLHSNVTEDRIEVALTGGLDMGAAFKLEPEIERLLGEHDVSRLVVDLAGVRFVDSAGIGALLSTHERAKAAGVELELANPSDPVRRILDVSGTGDMLTD